MSLHRRSAVGSGLLGLTASFGGSFGTGNVRVSVELSVVLGSRIGAALSELEPPASSIVCTADEPEVSNAIQKRIDCQLPAHYRQSGLAGGLSGQSFEQRNWYDLCGVDQLYADLRHYLGPQPYTWQAIVCPVCQSAALEWDRKSAFVLLTQPLRSTFSDDPIKLRVRSRHLTVQWDLWKPVVIIVVRRQVIVNGAFCISSVLFVLDISGFYLVRVPCKCASDVHSN